MNRDKDVMNWYHSFDFPLSQPNLDVKKNEQINILIKLKWCLNIGRVRWIDVLRLRLEALRCGLRVRLPLRRFFFLFLTRK